MHIVFLTNEYPNTTTSHGGIGTFVQNLGRGLVAKKVQVSVVGICNTSLKINLTIDEGVEVYRIPQSKAPIGKFIFNSFKIRKILKEIHCKKPINIVEGAELSFAFLPKKTPYKKVIRMHGGHHFFSVTLNKKPALWRSFQEIQSFKKADELIAVSNYVGITTQKLLKFQKKFTTIYNFIDLARFKNEQHNSIQPNSILFIGTICEKKGVKQLIEAFPLVKNKIPNATLHLVGRDWKSKELPSYISFIKKSIPLNCKNAIKFYGTVTYETIPKLLAENEVCVYPSLMESFGLTLIEAMAMQKPIVFSNIPPFKEIIKDGEEGLECNPLNPTDIAVKIIDMLVNKDKAKQMAKNSFNKVHFKFNSDAIIHENLIFYKSLSKI